MLRGCRAQILAKKVSARAFKVVPGKQGEAAGEIGIEGTTIEAPTEVLLLYFASLALIVHLRSHNVGLSMLSIAMLKAADWTDTVSSQSAVLQHTTKQLHACQQLVRGESICDGRCKSACNSIAPQSVVQGFWLSLVSCYLEMLWSLVVPCKSCALLVLFTT